MWGDPRGGLEDGTPADRKDRLVSWLTWVACVLRGPWRNREPKKSFSRRVLISICLRAGMALRRLHPYQNAGVIPCIDVALLGSRLLEDAIELLKSGNKARRMRIGPHPSISVAQVVVILCDVK